MIRQSLRTRPVLIEKSSVAAFVGHHKEGLSAVPVTKHARNAPATG
jgi:hypothetical protein